MGRRLPRDSRRRHDDRRDQTMDAWLRQKGVASSPSQDSRPGAGKFQVLMVKNNNNNNNNNDCNDIVDRNKTLL